MLCFALPGLLFACNPCPEGFEANHETEECVQKNGNSDTGSTDTVDSTDSTDTLDTTDTTDTTDTNDTSDTPDTSDTSQTSDLRGEVNVNASGCISTEDCPDGFTCNVDTNNDGIYDTCDDGNSGDTYAGKAFSYLDYNSNSAVLLVYVASNSDATCDSVAEYFAENVDDNNSTPSDPTDFFINDYCNFLIKFEHPQTSGFPWVTPIDANNYEQLLITTQCAFTNSDGSGSFDLGSINGQSDYFWSGAWYTAVAAYPTAVSALEETSNGHMLTIDIENLRGQYPLENRDANASSSASGTIYTELCPGLESAPFFD